MEFLEKNQNELQEESFNQKSSRENQLQEDL